MASEHRLADVVDLDRYPIHRLGQPEGIDLVRRLRTELATAGVCSLPDFVIESAVAATVAVGERLAPQAWHADQTHTVYFTDPDETLPAGDPRHRMLRSSQWAVAYDLLPPDLPARRLYEDDDMLRFVAAVLGTDRLHRSIDPLDALELSLFHRHGELNWHFDNSEFSVTLMLREPESGGHFEYHPAIRTDHDERIDSVTAALDGTGPAPRRLATAPGTLAIFQGRNSLHRVTPVSGPVARMNMVFTYGTEPDMCLSELTQKLFYGRRVEPGRAG